MGFLPYIATKCTANKKKNQKSLLIPGTVQERADTCTVRSFWCSHSARRSQAPPVARFGGALQPDFADDHSETLDGADDWEEALDMLLFHYSIRPHSVAKISPMRAMYGWEPNVLIEQIPEVFSASAWVDRLESQAAEILDYLEEQLAQMDWIDADDTACPYCAGDPVLLRQPERHRKLQPPYEVGWVVDRIVVPSTVRITSGNRNKVVNIDLLRLDRSSQARHDRFNDETLPLLGPVEEIDEEDYLAVEPAGHRLILQAAARCSRRAVAISELIDCLLTCSSLLLCAFIALPFFVFFFCFCMQCCRAEDCDSVYNSW